MVTGSTHPARVHHVDAGAHAVAWIAAILGLVAAAIGAYIVAAPEDGSLTLIDRTWSTGDLVDTWAPWLLAVGGAFAAIGMASYTNRGTSGVTMMIVGGVMVVAAASLVLLVDDPFPIWLLVSGAGLMFLAVGAAARADHQ